MKKLGELSVDLDHQILKIENDLILISKHKNQRFTISSNVSKEYKIKAKDNNQLNKKVEYILYKKAEDCLKSYMKKSYSEDTTVRTINIMPNPNPHTEGRSINCIEYNYIYIPVKMISYKGKYVKMFVSKEKLPYSLKMQTCYPTDSFLEREKLFLEKRKIEIAIPEQKTTIAIKKKGFKI